jgi:hypothetical protein
VSMFDLSNFTSFSTNDSFSVTSQSPVSRLFHSDTNKLYFEEIGGVRRFETDQTPQVVLRENFLDAKTGLLTGLVGGKQGWKCPVPLLMT